MLSLERGHRLHHLGHAGPPLFAQLLGLVAVLDHVEGALARAVVGVGALDFVARRTRVGELGALKN